MLKEIAEIINDSVTLNATIDIKDGEVTMMITFAPKVDDASLTGLPPVIINGTPEEVESDLIEFLKSPSVDNITKTATGVAEFEKASQVAAEENKVAKALKDKIDKLVDKGNKHLEKKETPKADKIQKEILELNPNVATKNYKEFSTSLNEAREKDSEGSLFAAADTPKLDADVEVRGKDERAVKHGINFSEDQQEIIEQERIDKLDQNGDTNNYQDF